MTQPMMTPMMPPVQPWGMPPMPGGEPPAREVSHERAVGAIGGIVMLFTSALVLILAIIFLVDLAWDWVGDEWEERVYRWEYGLAGLFMMASFGVGIAGAIGAFTMRRFKLALLGAVMLMVSSLGFIATWDPGSMVFYPVLGAVGLACVLLARNGFMDPASPMPGGAPPVQRDGYGKESGVP